VRIAELRHIGKESNHLEDVDSGLLHSGSAVYTEYGDPRRDPWLTDVVPALKRIRLAYFEQQTGKSRRMLIDARTGRRNPQRKHRELLIAVARSRGVL
jgi:hypothetical protein